MHSANLNPVEIIPFRSIISLFSILRRYTIRVRLDASLSSTQLQVSYTLFHYITDPYLLYLVY